MKTAFEWILFIIVIVLPLMCLAKVCLTYLFKNKNKKGVKENGKSNEKTDSN